MKLHELKPAEGSRQERKRKGRGIGTESPFRRKRPSRI